MTERVPTDILDLDLAEHLQQLVLDELDDEDEPVLRWNDGRLVDTWREGYPYDERMGRLEYDVLKRQLQIEMLKLQNWIKDTGRRLVIHDEVVSVVDPLVVGPATAVYETGESPGRERI